MSVPHASPPLVNPCKHSKLTEWHGLSAKLSPKVNLSKLPFLPMYLYNIRDLHVKNCKTSYTLQPSMSLIIALPSQDLCRPTLPLPNPPSLQSTDSTTSLAKIDVKFTMRLTAAILRQDTSIRLSFLLRWVQVPTTSSTTLNLGASANCYVLITEESTTSMIV